MDLTAKEFKLLEYFAARPGTVSVTQLERGCIAEALEKTTGWLADAAGAAARPARPERH